MPRWLDPFLDLVFPAVCPVCEIRSDDPVHRPFCARCWAGLPLLGGPVCRVCGAPFPGLGDGLACDACRRDPPAFRWARAVAAYRDGMRAAIHALKYGRRPAVARPLARLLAEAGAALLAPPDPNAAAGGLPDRVPGVAPHQLVDAIVPVPLHPARLAERGFNQSELLAHECAARWRIPLRSGALVRTRFTRPQTELGETERRRNVAGAFGVARPHEIAGQRVLLVDDVLTTGATAGAAAVALVRGGAAAVGVLVLARA